MSRRSNRLPALAPPHEAELCQTFECAAITYGDIAQLEEYKCARLTIVDNDALECATTSAVCLAAAVAATVFSAGPAGVDDALLQRLSSTKDAHASISRRKAAWLRQSFIFAAVTRRAWRVTTGVSQSLAELLVSEWLPITPRSPALAVTRQRWHVTTPDRRLAAVSTVAVARTPPRAAQMFLLESPFDSVGCGVTGQREGIIVTCRPASE